MDDWSRPSKSATYDNSTRYKDLQRIIGENALPFLSAKALYRCIGICRDWKRQISTPFFAHKQSVSFRDLSGFFCQSSSDPPFFISLDSMLYGVPDPSLKFLPEPVYIRCSSNGLLCCQGRTGYKDYYICNPVTRKFEILPQPHANHGSDPALVLVFEPSPMKFEAEYKLVCAFESDLGGYEFEIYSSANGSWKISRELCFGDRHIHPRSGVHVDGFVYWTSEMSGRSDIVAFDLSSERAAVVEPLAPVLGQLHGTLCCASLSGSRLIVYELAIPYTITQMMNLRQLVWEEITIKLEMLDGRGHDHAKVLYVHDDIAVVRFGRTLVSYNMNTKETIQLTAEVDLDATMVPYVNSLVEFI